MLTKFKEIKKKHENIREQTIKKTWVILKGTKQSF